MVKTISATRFQTYQDEGWKVTQNWSNRDGHVYTLVKKDDLACCARTISYTLTAPFVLAFTSALAVPACIFGSIISTAQETPRSETDLTEREYASAQRGLSNVSDNTADCAETVCSWNGNVCEYFQPGERTYKMKVFVPSEREPLITSES